MARSLSRPSGLIAAILAVLAVWLGAAACVPDVDVGTLPIRKVAPTAIPNDGATQAPYLPASPTASPTASLAGAAPRMVRGYNLAGTLDPTESYWGPAIAGTNLATIAQAGFDTVRLPVRWSLHTAASPPYAIDAAFLARVDDLVEKALAAGLVIILDFHNFTEFTSDPNGQTDRFEAIWRQLAEHYRGQPPSVLYEVLNEPPGSLSVAAWDALAAKAMNAIRAADPDRWVVLSGLNYTPPGRLRHLGIPPAADTRTIGTFHYYVPMHFSHQGATWVRQDLRTAGVVWPGPPAAAKTPSPEAAAYQVANPPSVTEWFADFSTLPADFNPAGYWPLTDLLDRAVRWSAQTGKPLFLGEFGAEKFADADSRSRYLGFIRQEAERRRIPWAVWDDGNEFKVFDRKTGTWLPGLDGALMPAAGTALPPVATPAPGPAAPDLAVWQGGLQTGWTTKAWRIDQDTCWRQTSSAPCALGVTGNEAWWGLGFQYPGGVDTTGFGGVTLEVQASAHDEEIALLLYDDKDQFIGTRVPLHRYGGAPPAASPKRYYVPLYSLGGVDRRIRGLAVVDASGSAQPTFRIRLGLI